jgi:hypothetical protein
MRRQLKWRARRYTQTGTDMQPNDDCRGGSIDRRGTIRRVRAAKLALPNLDLNMLYCSDQVQEERMNSPKKTGMGCAVQTSDTTP